MVHYLLGARSTFYKNDDNGKGKTLRQYGGTYLKTTDVFQIYQQNSTRFHDTTSQNTDVLILATVKVLNLIIYVLFFGPELTTVQFIALVPAVKLQVTALGQVHALAISASVFSFCAYPRLCERSSRNIFYKLQTLHKYETRDRLYHHYHYP